MCIINNKKVALEMVVIVSQGFSDTKTTSLIRKKPSLLKKILLKKVLYVPFLKLKNMEFYAK